MWAVCCRDDCTKGDGLVKQTIRNPISSVRTWKRLAKTRRTISKQRQQNKLDVSVVSNTKALQYYDYEFTFIDTNTRPTFLAIQVCISSQLHNHENIKHMRSENTISFSTLLLLLWVWYHFQISICLAKIQRSICKFLTFPDANKKQSYNYHSNVVS